MDGKFTACMDMTFPPMEYYEGASKDPKGYDVSVIKALTELWGLEPVMKDTAFDGLLPALSAGRCDVAWSSMYITPERTANFAAVQYGKSRTVFLVQQGNPKNIKSEEDLAGKTIAGQAGTQLLETTKGIVAKLEKQGKPAAHVQVYGKATELIQQLIVGRADAVPTIDLEAQFRVQQTPGKFEIGFALPGAERIGIFFKPDNRELGEALIEGLSALEKDGTLEKIAREEGFPVEGIAIGDKVLGP